MRPEIGACVHLLLCFMERCWSTSSANHTTNIHSLDEDLQTGMEPRFILFFNCPEAVMERRLMGRNEGRTDDNAETIRKRFKVSPACAHADP